MEMKKHVPEDHSETIGTIKSIDPAAHNVTLDTGKVCHCGQAVDLADFKPGDTVTMAFTDKDGQPECCQMAHAA